MKIKLFHDAAFVYDFLSVYQIKFEKNKNDENACKNFQILNDDIASQVGYKKHDQIVDSEEYIYLLKINREIYEKIDNIKANGEELGDAIYIDNKNYQRWIAKNKLQQVWFKTQLTEQKFGYKNEN
jgi:hypothetical protein